MQKYLWYVNVMGLTVTEATTKLIHENLPISKTWSGVSGLDTCLNMCYLCCEGSDDKLDAF